MLSEIYKNIHKSKQEKTNVFSIRNHRTKKVVAYFKGPFYIKEAFFKVSIAGRNRVVKEQRKNVHAFIKGYPTFSENIKFPVFFKGVVSYNPYLFPYFFDVKTEEEIISSDLLYVNREGTIFYS